MRTCQNCHCQMENEAIYCPVCGTAASTYIPPNPNYQEPKVSAAPVLKPDDYDHSADFLAEDIAASKLICMLVYLLDFIGIIIGLLAAKESEYTAFHIRQSMKFTITEILICLFSVLLCWTIIVPIAAVLALVVLLVIKFVCFTQVCSGKAVEPVLIRSIVFLK